MRRSCASGFFFFFFNDTATTEIYTLSLHDALPIFPDGSLGTSIRSVDEDERASGVVVLPLHQGYVLLIRSEEHTSELQSQSNLVCRLLLEKKKNTSTRCISLRSSHIPILSAVVTQN